MAFNDVKGIVPIKVKDMLFEQPNMVLRHKKMNVHLASFNVIEYFNTLKVNCEVFVFH